MPSDKLVAALASLERSRIATLETALAERSYRLAPVLDDQGTIQRAIDRARRLIRAVPPTPRPKAAKSA